MKPYFYITIIVILLTILIPRARADIVDDIVPTIIQAESSGRANAIGKDGEIGLMQISKILWTEFSLITNITLSQEMLYDPRVNKYIGTWYLRRLAIQLEKVGKLDKAHLVYAYNSGLSRALNNPIPRRHKNRIYNKIYKEYWKEK